MRRLIALICLTCLALPAAADAGKQETRLRKALASAMNGAGPASGAYAYNATERRVLFRRRDDRPRILASNTKLFTTAAALGRLGPTATLDTRVLGDGELDGSTWRGDLYLVGGGDPAFGSERFVDRAYGSGATVERLAAEIERAGIERIRGRIMGDESFFDSRRGGPDSGYRFSYDVGGPLSGLAYNRGLANEVGSAIQTNPPLFAAKRLDAALAREDVGVSSDPRAGTAPSDAEEVAKVESPTLRRLARLTNKPSDNYFAEMLLKGIGARVRDEGSTASGARAARGFARDLGTRARVVDGSGLSRRNKASPRQVAELLIAMRERKEFDAFQDSLAVAGRDGTLGRRMRRGPARGRCRGKTGTLSNVSALSGYCRSRGGDKIVFSILMNRTSPPHTRGIQDRMAQALARYAG